MLYTKESLSKINPMYLMDCMHTIDEYEVCMVNDYIEHIEKTRSDKFPKIGDIVKVTTKHGDCYPTARIQCITSEETLSVMGHAHTPFITKNKGGILASIGGGPEISFQMSEVKYVGTEPAIFSDWGKWGPGAHSAVSFFANVSVWEYEEQGSLYNGYNTKEHNMYYFYKEKDKENPRIKPAFSSFSTGLRFENEAKLRYWLQTRKGVVFGDIDNDDSIVVFVYKEKHCLMPREQWADLNLQISREFINGACPIPTKVEYNDDEHFVTFYRYTNSSSGN